MGLNLFYKDCDLTRLQTSRPFYENNDLFVYTHSCPTGEIAYFKIPTIEIEKVFDTLGGFQNLY